jgi:tRNA pseudouridine38-40 synthase
MENHRYFVEMSYNGTRYHGWQIQPNGNTVQAEITGALRLLLNEPELSVTGAGRTDTGVHARNFPAHFDVKHRIENPEDTVFKLNRFLPADIVIHNIRKVDNKAHARFDAKQRTYHYFITTEKDPFSQETSWYLYGRLDVEEMNRAASLLKNHSDFTSFSKLHTQVKTNNCRIDEAYWELRGKMLIFKISADRFLRNMVRAIVGSLVDVGKGRLTAEDFEDIILARDRSKAGESAPARGLFLTEVKY